MFVISHVCTILIEKKMYINIYTYIYIYVYVYLDKEREIKIYRYLSGHLSDS